MEILVKFGYRTYVFYSREDITTATGIYAYNTGDLDSFESELKDNNINFCYDEGYGPC